MNGLRQLTASFFNWLLEKTKILKSPTRGINRSLDEALLEQIISGFLNLSFPPSIHILQKTQGRTGTASFVSGCFTILILDVYPPWHSSLDAGLESNWNRFQ